jgi:hypothetical protein
MQTLQEFIVNEHIDDLRREAELLRTERRMRHRTRLGVATLDATGNASIRRPVRVRLGQWLIGIGTAVSGSPGDANSGTAEHAA